MGRFYKNSNHTTRYFSNRKMIALQTKKHEIAKFIIIQLNIIFLASSIMAQENDILTSSKGEDSPAIIAENIAISYGLKQNIVLELIKVYDKKGVSTEERKVIIENLVKNYKSISIKGSELSEDEIQELGISGQDDLLNILNWDIFISTEGKNSPAVYAPDGNVEIWYGISNEAFKTIYRTLEKKQLAIEDFDKQLKNQVNKLKELEKELQDRNNEIGIKVEELLNQGKINEAEYILEKDALKSNKKIASKNFKVGKVKELNYKYSEANNWYRLAISLDTTNIDYLNAYADNLFYNAELDEAIKYYNIILKLLDSVNNKSEMLSSIYNDLGGVYHSKNLFDKAIRFYKKSLNIKLKTFGKDYHSDIAITYNNIGLSYESIGKYDTAVIYIQQALSILKNTKKVDNLYLASTYNNLGYVNESKGDIDKAIEYYYQALSIFLHIYEDNHPYLASIFINIGSIHGLNGKYDTALSFFNKALPISLNAYGNEHPVIATIYNNIGFMYYSNEKYDKAIEYYNQAIEIYYKVYGNKHRLIATSYNNLGLTYDEKGEFDLAINYFNQALSIDLSIFQEEHITIAKRYNNLGYAYNYKEDYDSAIIFFEKALLIRSKFHSQDHSNLKKAQESLMGAYHHKGLVLYSNRKFEESMYYCNKAYNICFILNDSSCMISCLSNIASSLISMNMCEQAIEYLDTSIIISTSFNNYSYQTVLFQKASCLHSLRRNNEAAILFNILRQLAIKNNDYNLLEDIEHYGY
ncbi:MAG: tetratricopeptide repeat protein [Bacteroidales bacterium]|nr:tetratricopeptide repeat protein [Bacteroidales bacterium]